MEKLIKFLFSPLLMAIILLAGIIAMASATFIENDYGAQVAREVVYGAKWFELLILVFCINLIGSIFTRKLYKKSKFPIFLFHIAFIVMIIGAAITRYIGYEGVMHIREGESSSIIKTQSKALSLEIVQGKKTKIFNWNEAKILRKKGFNDKIKINNEKFEIELKYYYPNAKEKAIAVEGGQPTIGFVVADNNYKGFAYLTKGESQKFGNTIISYGKSNKPNDISIIEIGDSLYIESEKGTIISTMSMPNNGIEANNRLHLQTNQVYKIGSASFILHETFKEAVISAFPVNNRTEQGIPALIFNISNGNKTQKLTLWDNGNNYYNNTALRFGNYTLTGNYGNRNIHLPFKIHLDDFEIKRYPGSRSPSSFSSYVHIIKTGIEPKPFHIYMNNILQMEGYRFYQSSYDKDEQGTILSVNYDSLGTGVTYLGYFLLFIGIVLSMLTRSSFLKNTVIPKTVILFAVFLTTTVLSISATSAQNIETKISDKHAEKFGKLLIQDNKGRTEPVYTFASDLIRKLSRKEEIMGLNPVQLFLEMNMNYEVWMDKPIIKITNQELQEYLELRSNYASYNHFVASGVYKLQKQVEKAYKTPPGKQSKFDKAVIKADERLNICYAIFSGLYIKMFPVPGTDAHEWHTPQEAISMITNTNDSAFLANILPAYFQELYHAKSSGDYKTADNYIEAINKYQQKYASYELPSAFKTKLEVKYYKWNIFKKLFPFYSTVGVIFLFALLIGIISGKPVSKKTSSIFSGIILLGFIAHGLTLAARWYISGHAPMSNGYESMVFISFITMLAGFIFSRQSLLALSATSVLSGFMLMVANLSFMDPEITNLVPVLKSYWLTVHVSVITGSYGFLALGAILGIINLILNIIQNNKNSHRIDEAINQLTIINHRTLILGLYFLTIGTFLGAVWANESWGRYWGWDPKETWSLITLIVYTFVTHARMVPGVRGRFAFNTLSVYAFFSVLMTYFGVNYYLSGLHSYAAGDPVPIPTFVYISVLSIIALTLIAYFRFIKNNFKTSS